jgi:hypothetical protein
MAAVNTNPPILSKQQIARFWSYVDTTPGLGPQGSCWPWTRSSRAGYGMFSAEHRSHGAHRIAFYLTRGYWPLALVCHRCDWQICCNPTHLFDGDQFANMGDAVAKGHIKGPRGEKQGRAKLNAAQVLEIRSRYTSRKMTHKELSRVYGISQSHVTMIINRQTWSHI